MLALGAALRARPTDADADASVVDIAGCVVVVAGRSPLGQVDMYKFKRGRLNIAQSLCAMLSRPQEKFGVCPNRIGHTPGQHTSTSAYRASSRHATANSSFAERFNLDHGQPRLSHSPPPPPILAQVHHRGPPAHECPMRTMQWARLLMEEVGGVPPVAYRRLPTLVAAPGPKASQHRLLRLPHLLASAARPLATMPQRRKAFDPDADLPTPASGKKQK